MRYKLFILITIICFLLMNISGCYDRREIDNLALVVGVGIDPAQAKDKIKVTVQLIKPQQIAEGGGGGKSFWTVTTTGVTIEDAISSFVERAGRELYWAHNMVIIVGEELARRDIDEYLDYFNRDPELRRRSWLVVAKDIEAKEILEAESELEEIPARDIDLSIKNSMANSEASSVDLQLFDRRLAIPQVSPIASRIELVEENKLKKEEKMAQKTGKPDPKKKYRITGSAVFKQDKLVGWFGEEKARGLLWVTGEVAGGVINIPAPGVKKDTVSFDTIKSINDITTQLVNGKPVINIKVKTEGSLAETMVGIDVVKFKYIDILERKLANEVRREIRQAIEQAQKWQTDIFGFARTFEIAYPQKWKEIKDRWEEKIFPRLQVNIEVEAKIRRFGLMKEPTRAK